MTDLVLSKRVFRLGLLVVPKYLSMAISELFGHLIKIETPRFYFKPQNQNAKGQKLRKLYAEVNLRVMEEYFFKLWATFISRL